MDSTPKRQQRARPPIKKEDIKQFDPLATPSPKKSDVAHSSEQRKSIEMTIEPLFNTKTRVPFTGIRGNRLRMVADKQAPESHIGRFCIRHTAKTDHSIDSHSEVDESFTLTPSRSEDDNIVILSPVKSKPSDRDLLDLLF